MDNTFVWTDDLVKEYIKYLQQGKGCGKWHPMEEFKKSKEVKKDYEIECIVKDSRNYWRQKDQLYNSELFGSHASDKWLLDNGGKIYSIKRLSDSETFSIRSNYKGCPHCNTHYITSFEIINGELIVKREDGRIINFATIIPVKKEPIFTKEEEQEIISLIHLHKGLLKN